MNLNFKSLTILSIFALLSFSCGSDDDSSSSNNLTQKSDVISNYAAIVLTSYQAALTDAQALETSINTFVSSPNDANFTAAKDAWKTARESYGPTEAYRFANGPIDTGTTEDVEGWLNSWPLDEVFIDYVDGNTTSGIINNTVEAITKANLTGLNGANNSEANVAIGYHAIEFLLWGQDYTDPSNQLAGQRPYTDYVDGGTASNQDRRRDYLTVCADLITDHLQIVIEEWDTNGTYRSTFLVLNEDEALKNMLGIAELAGSELAVERMEVALNLNDQEDEHSCFSDNTHRDIRLNLDGVANVYRGSYSSINGASLEDLITEADATLGASITALLTIAESEVNATAIPFDYAITNSGETAQVATAIQALKDFSDELVLGAAALGITINL
ncbi:imelysin family protein [Winogradskyella sp.]|uniref:imelysin family protein n=1 Tax=Winogradskyella sp. TaxID=1883156 RepID=UPI0025E90049|nr:imelysin family protein [Winogradskyella sp.]